MHYARLFKIFSSALFLIAILTFIAVCTTALIAPEELKLFFSNFMEKIHGFGLIGAAMIMAIAALTAFPAELPAIACGAMYGLTNGVFVIWITAMIGSSLAFAVGRYVDPAFLEMLVGKTVYSKIRERANEKTGLMTLFIVRLIPYFPFFVVNFASGMSGMRYGGYFLATGLGIIPGAVVSSAIGAGLLSSNSVVLLIVLSLLILFAFVWKLYSNRNS